jgi:Zn finger protein HypA/HybF involved in hydrogenase expression
MDTDELVECFDYVVAQLSQAGEGAFEGARLRLETVPAHIRCACGFQGPVAPDDIAGHMGICPGCGRVSELSQPPLELLGLSFAGTATICAPPA